MVSGYFRESAKKVAEVREIERKAHRLLYSKDLVNTSENIGLLAQT